MSTIAPAGTEIPARQPIPLYQAIARAFDAWRRSLENENEKWAERHVARIELMIESLPHGSGIDGETGFDFNASKPDRLVIYGEYHHMNDNGFYTGWDDFAIIVKPSLAFGADITVTGGGDADTREYLGETFHFALNKLVDEYASAFTKK